MHVALTINFCELGIADKENWESTYVKKKFKLNLILTNNKYMLCLKSWLIINDISIPSSSPLLCLKSSELLQAGKK